MNQPPVLNWSEIDTVLLDMDGTLLDLHFDNYFWLKHVPLRFAEMHQLDAKQAEQQLTARYKQIEGTLNWYCVDHWSEILEMDIVKLKREVSHLINVHDYVTEFLQALRKGGKRIVMVTNAHNKSLDLKMEITQLNDYFDRLICSHELGKPKEDPEFWADLQQLEPFDKERSLLVDDSLPVLTSARDYGIAHTLGILKPDTKKPSVVLEGFNSITHFGEVLPIS